MLVEHCVKSNGGLYYSTRDEFVECLKLLMGDAGLRAAMGRNGREYVGRNVADSTGGAQKPTSVRDNLTNDFPIAGLSSSR